MTSLGLALATTGGLKCVNCQCLLIRFRRNDAQCQQGIRESWETRSVHGAWKSGKLGRLAGGRKCLFLVSGKSSRLCKRPYVCQVFDSAVAVSLWSPLQSIAPFAQLVGDTISGIISGSSNLLQAEGQLSSLPELDLSAAPLYIFASVLMLAVGSATYGLLRLHSSDDDTNGSSRPAEVPGLSTEDWVLLGSDTQFYSFVYSRCSSMSVGSLEPGSSRPAEAKVVQVRRMSDVSRKAQDLLYQRCCIHTLDGGVISLDLPAHLDMEGAEELDSALLIVPGTVEGSAAEGIQAFVSKALGSGYFPVVFNPRGCGSSPVTSPRLFTAADSDDLQLSIEYLQNARPNATIVAVGFGFGANILTKYLEEEASSSRLKAAICVANPFDMEHATTLLSQSPEDDYKLTQGLVHLLKANQSLFQSYQKNFDLVKGFAATSMREFDAAISMVSHGFASLKDFYAHASSGTKLWRVETPLLCIQAEYSAAPLLTVPSQEFERNPFLTLLVSPPIQGGKEGRSIEDVSACPDFALEWLAAVELALLKGRYPLDGTENVPNSEIGEGGALGKEVPSLETNALRKQSLLSSEAAQTRHRREDLEMYSNVPQPFSTNELMNQDADGRSFFARPEDLGDRLIDMPDTSYQVHKADVEEDQGAREVKASTIQLPSLGGVTTDSDRGQGHGTLSNRGLLPTRDVEQNQNEKQPQGQHGSAQVEGEGEAERGRVEQATESIMKVLDVTMPGTLSAEQKKKVIAAVGRGETVLNAFQEAVPEDVRGKMFEAVAGAMQARGISSQLVGFGKNLPPPTFPDDMIKTIKEKMSSMSLGPQNSSNSSQPSQTGPKVGENVAPEPQGGTSSQDGDRMLGDSTGSDQKDASKVGQEAGDKPQADVRKPADDGQSPGIPNAGESGIQTQVANQDKQSQGSDENMDASQPATSGRYHKEVSENKTLNEAGVQTQTESAKQDDQSDVSAGPKDMGELGRVKDKGNDNQGQGQVDQIKHFHDEVMETDRQDKKDDQSPAVKQTGSEMDSGQRHESVSSPAKDVGIKGDDGGKNDSESVHEVKSDQDVKQDKKPDIPDVHDTQAQADQGLGQKDVKTSGPETAHVAEQTQQPQPDKSSQDRKDVKTRAQDTAHVTEQTQQPHPDKCSQDQKDVKTGAPDSTHVPEQTQQPQPDKSSQDDPQPPSVQTFIPPSGQNPSSLDISSVLQTFTGFDDSTQMAVTNVFGVVESLLDKLERESEDDSEQKLAEQKMNYEKINDREQKPAEPGTQGKAEMGSENPGNTLEDPAEADILSRSSKKSDGSETDGTVSAQGDLVDSSRFSGPSDDSAIKNKLQSTVQELNESVGNDGKALYNREREEALLARSLSEQDKSEQDAPNIVKQIVLDALTLELLRRVGQAGLEASGIDLQLELQNVANAVTEAVQSAAISLTTPKVGPGSQMDGKLGVLPAEAVVTALCSVLGTTSILKGLVPVGVLAGVVLSALGACFLIATNGMGEKEEEQEYSNLEDKLAKKFSFQQDRGKGTQDSEDLQGPAQPEGALASMKTSSIMGVVAGAIGAVHHDVGALEEKECSKKGAETPSIVSDIADKAISVAAPVVPKKEDGEIDQERIVAFLADLGQKGGVLRLLGKAALLWGGLRGAMSLTDRMLIFLKMSDRPLHQRLLGFLGLSLLLWAPIFVPLLPSLLEQWSSQTSSGVAGFAAVVGLYGAIIILITIWGRRIRGYEQPLVHYGLRITSLSKLTVLGSGLGLGVLLVAAVYTVEAYLGYVQFFWSAHFVSGATAIKVGIVTASLPAAVVTAWKLATLVAQACGVGFAVALVEELLFRSWLQEEIAVDLGFQNAVLLCAAAFAIIHWSLPAMPGLFFLSIALAGTRARQKGDLSFPIGLHAGLVSANYVLTVGGFIQYIVGSPDWLTGAHVANPLAGALGLAMVAALALLVYPRDGRKP